MIEAIKERFSLSSVIFFTAFIYALFVSTFISALFFITATINYMHKRKIESTRPAVNPLLDDLGKINERIDDISTQVTALSFKTGIGHINAQ